MKNFRDQRWAWGSMAAMLVLSVATLIGSIPAASQGAKTIQPQKFATPDAAVKAIVDAARRNSDQDLIKIYGSAGEDLFNSGDAVQDAQRRAKFIEEICYRISQEIRDVLFELRNDAPEKPIAKQLSMLFSNWSLESNIKGDFLTTGNDMVFPP